MRQSTESRVTSHQYIQLSSWQKAKFVPVQANLDIPQFLEKCVGRGISAEHAAKIQNWEQLFNSSSKQFKDLGIPTKARRAILGAREWYKRGMPKM
jgi:hypothetical protein